MSYETIEASVEDGSPVYLYQFAQSGVVWRYTNDLLPVTHAGEGWASAPISHGEINQTGEITRDSVKLTLPISHPFGAQFVGYPPEFVTTVTIFRGHRGSDDFLVWWKGRISTSRVVGVTLELECESVFSSLKRPGLRRKSQRPCPHAVYYGLCRLDKADFAIPAEVVSVSGVNVTLSVSPVLPDGTLMGGMLESPTTGELRMVMEQTGGAVVLSRPLAALSSDARSVIDNGAGYGRNYGNFYGGFYVQVYPGCNRTPARCAQFPNADNPSGTNIENYGGFSFKPSKNPFAGGSVT